MGQMSGLLNNPDLMGSMMNNPLFSNLNKDNSDGGSGEGTDRVEGEEGDEDSSSDCGDTCNDSSCNISCNTKDDIKIDELDADLDLDLEECAMESNNLINNKFRFEENIVLQNLNNKTYNDSNGLVIDYNSDKERYLVQLTDLHHNDKQILVRESNIVISVD